MRELSATEVVRSFRKILDSLASGGEEIVIVRNRRPVRKTRAGRATHECD